MREKINWWTIEAVGNDAIKNKQIYEEKKRVAIVLGSEQRWRERDTIESIHEAMT